MQENGTYTYYLNGYERRCARFPLAIWCNILFESISIVQTILGIFTLYYVYTSHKNRKDYSHCKIVRNVVPSVRLYRYKQLYPSINKRRNDA